MQAALSSGALDGGRYENYLQLQGELRHLARKQDQQLRQAERDKWRKVALYQRQLKRDRDGHR